MKSLLILGASTYQVPAILMAKDLGYRVIVADNVPANPGHALADKSYIVSTTEKEEIFGIAKSESITGVLAIATDVAVPTVAYVAARLGLPGPTEKAAKVLCSKIKFREFLSYLGLPMPKYHVIKPHDPLGLDVDWGCSWVLKPNKSSGSKGIFIVDAPDALRKYLPETRSFGVEEPIILEEFIIGNQGTCEGILKNSQIAFAAITDRLTAEPPYVATMGHTVPSRLPVFLQKKLLEQLEFIFTNLGLESTPFDCDFVASNDQIFVLEVTPRVGGNSLWKLVETAYNFNLLEYAVKNACGEDPSHPLDRSAIPTAVRIFGSNSSGVLSYSVDGLQSLKKEPWVKEILFDIPIGSKVKQFRNGRDRIGECIIVGKTLDDLQENLLKLRDNLAIFSKPSF